MEQENQLRIRIQEISLTPIENLTDESKREYYECALELLSLVVKHRNECIVEAYLALERFIDLIGIAQRLITIDQAAHDYGIPPGTIRRWLHEGLLEAKGRHKNPGPGRSKTLISAWDIIRLKKERSEMGRKWALPRIKKERNKNN